MTQATAEDRRLLDIKLILKDMLKTIKVVAMYPEGNPLPQSLRRSFAEKLTSLIETRGTIDFVVKSDTLSWGEHDVFVDSSKEESLAGLFFNTGITSLSFKEGLDVLEVYTLLDIIKAYQNQATKGADLVCMLWEASFANIGFSSIEDIRLAEYDGDFKVQEICLEKPGDGKSSYDEIFALVAEDAGLEVSDLSSDDTAEASQNIDPEQLEQFEQLMSSEEGRERIKRRLLARKRASSFYAVDPAASEEDQSVLADENSIDSVSLKVSEAAKAMGFDDLKPSNKKVPDTVLILNDEFKLSEEEELEIKRLLDEDAQFDPYESTIELLKEMLFQESELSAFFETVSICEKMVQDFVSHARLNEARHVLEYLSELEEKLKETKPLWAERLHDARTNCGSRERLKFLVESLNTNPNIPMADLHAYLDLFGWESLGSITDLLGELNHRVHREALCDYLSERGRDNIAIVAKGMYDKRWYVVRNSVAILARLDDDKAMGYLQKAITHEDRRVRLELMKALKISKSPRAMDILRKAAVDPDAEIRKEALASIVGRGGKAAFAAISEVVGSDSYPNFEQNEQQKILNAYSRLGGAEAVEFLEQLVTRPNVFRDQLVSFYRKAGFTALAYNASAEAEQLLLKLASSWRPEVRKQAKLILDQRRVYLLRQTVESQSQSEETSDDH